MAEMRMRAIFGVLLAVTAILVGPRRHRLLRPGRRTGVDRADDQQHRSLRGRHVHTRARSRVPSRIIWDVNITQTGDAPTNGPVTFTNILPPGVKLVGIGHGSFYTGCGPLLHA